MASKQSHPSLQDDRFTIRLKKNATDGSPDAGSYVVKAPLPETWGFTVGSEFSAPFDGNFIAGTGAALLGAAGVSSKLGIATKKLYSSPEPTEISLELQFEAYEDAMNDVLIPVIVLMSMGIGSRLTLEEAANLIEDMANQASSNAGQGTQFEQGTLASRVTSGSVGQGASRAFDFLNFVQGPPTVTLRFGNVVKFRNTYVTSVAPQFSNIMDSNGVPMSARVSVTAILELDPLIDDDNFADFFNMAGNNV